MSTSLTNQLCILVIDDDPEIAELIVQCLITQDHQVVTAYSAEEGMSYLPFYDFDLIFLDHNLPGMEGLTLGRYLNQNAPHIYLVLITGDASKKIERLCSQHEIQLIAKPFELDDLLNTVSYVQKRILDEEKRVIARQQTPLHRGDSMSPQGEEVSPKVDLSLYTPLLQEHYQLPLIPHRATHRLTQKIKRALDQMRHSQGADYQRYRALAYAGLITALVFGVRMSKLKEGKTPWQVYDELLESRGELPEFKHLDS